MSYTVTLAVINCIVYQYRCWLEVCYTWFNITKIVFNFGASGTDGDIQTVYTNATGGFVIEKLVSIGG